MSPCLVAQTPMDKLITDIAFLVIAHHGGIQKPWEEEKAENEEHDEKRLLPFIGTKKILGEENFPNVYHFCNPFSTLLHLQM